MKSKYKAIIYIILSAFSFAFMFAFVRLSGNLPTVQKTFFRNFVALFFAIGVLKKNHIRFHIEGKKNNAVIFVHRARITERSVSSGIDSILFHSTI